MLSLFLNGKVSIIILGGFNYQTLHNHRLCILSANHDLICIYYVQIEPKQGMAFPYVLCL